MFFIIFLSTMSWAFNGALEWSAYTPRELKIEQNFSSVDSEFVSDQLAYSHDIEQEFVWMKQQKVADFTFGSISSDRFYHQSRLKLLTPIHSNWQFEYILFEQSDYEIDQSNSWLGLSYRPWEFMSVALYGTPKSDKGVIDYKFSTSFYILNGVLSLYSVKSDFMKNSKSIDGAEYTERPNSYGLTWKKDFENSFIILKARIDPLAQLTTQDSRQLESKNSTYQILFQHQLLSQIWRLKAEFSQLYEKSDSDWAKQQIHEVRLESEGQVLGGGVLWKQYLWKTDSGHLDHNNVLPYMFYYLSKTDVIQKLTVESTFHESYKYGAVNVSNTDCSSCYEYRLNYAILKQFNDEFSFKFKFTFDLDEFGTANTWEGGSGHFYLRF